MIKLRIFFSVIALLITAFVKPSRAQLDAQYYDQQRQLQQASGDCQANRAMANFGKLLLANEAVYVFNETNCKFELEAPLGKTVTKGSHDKYDILYKLEDYSGEKTNSSMFFGNRNNMLCKYTGGLAVKKWCESRNAYCKNERHSFPFEDVSVEDARSGVCKLMK
jgi:hypothetical protein